MKSTSESKISIACIFCLLCSRQDYKIGSHSITHFSISYLPNLIPLRTIENTAITVSKFACSQNKNSRSINLSIRMKIMIMQRTIHTPPRASLRRLLYISVELLQTHTGAFTGKCTRAPRPRRVLLYA